MKSNNYNNKKGGKQFPKRDDKKITGKQFNKKENKRSQEKEQRNFDDQVEGRNSVLELL